LKNVKKAGLIEEIDKQFTVSFEKNYTFEE